MTIIDELNSASTVVKAVSIGSLHVNTRYLIKDVRSVNTRYGRSVAATIFDPVNEENVDIYMPHRVSTFLQEDIIQDINNGPPMCLVYLGKIGEHHDVKFEYV